MAHPTSGEARHRQIAASGAFYRPSLIEVVDLSAPMIQQETFGPVATFEVFNDEHVPSTGLTRPSSAWPQACSPAMPTVLAG
jgi:delta 1-pyrroline-5-carboxylate dehydrogenase